MDSGGVLHAADAASHAQSSSSSSPAAAVSGGAVAVPTSPINYRQVGTRKGNGRLLLGAAHSYHASSVASQQGPDAANALLGSVPSIPSRFETVLYAGDQAPDAFLSRCARFRTTVPDLPGPGAYAGDVVASNTAIKQDSTSFSKKGFGVGFVSKAKRFTKKGGGPGPGTYVSHVETLASRTSSAPNRGAALSGTAAFRPVSTTVLDPRLSSDHKNADMPGPGAYHQTTKTVVLTASQQRKIANKFARSPASPTDLSAMNPTLQRAGSSSALAAALQSKTTLTAMLSPLATASPDPAFSSKDTRFRQPRLAREPGPAAYSPNFEAVKPQSSAHTGLFKSQTNRTDFTRNTSEVPGPGTYTGSIEEKSNDDRHRVTSPSRVFKLTGVDRFGHVLEPRVEREQLPAPGSYDPLLPNTRADSPLRGVPTAMLGTAKHPAKLPTSPLAASMSHGLPLERSLSPSKAEQRMAANTDRRKKRAAGAGGLGKGLHATRGGAGVSLNSTQLLLHPAEYTTFGTSGQNDYKPSPQAVANAALVNAPALVSKESEIRPPGPAFYKNSEAFHALADKKEFHLNTINRWM